MALRILFRNTVIRSGISHQINNSICKRDSSYRSSNIAQDPSHYAKYEVSSSPEEWKFVENLLPSTIIPSPPDSKSLPSGWQPQTAEFGKYPYFVHRTRNHMLPVYLKVSMRGTRRITQINNVDGNIWALEEAIKKYLQRLYGDKKIIATKVHEVCGHLCIHGDHVSRINEWLLKKAEFGKYPYFVHRTRNHMLPVYLKVSMRGTRRITQINNVDGNIWALEEAIKKYLQRLYGDKKIIATKVHEVCGHLCIHGDHVSRINEWLLKKGL